MNFILLNKVISFIQYYILHLEGCHEMKIKEFLNKYWSKLIIMFCNYYYVMYWKYWNQWIKKSSRM